MADLYVTSAAFKATLTLTGETFADADITVALEAASRGIDRLCRRRFYPDTDANQIRYYQPLNGTVYVDDLITLTALATDDYGYGAYTTTWTLNTDFTLAPDNAVADGEPWRTIETHPLGAHTFPNSYPRGVKVTGKFGWTAPPSQVVAATTILAARLMRRSREAPFGIVTVGIDTGTAMRIGQTDPEVPFLLAPYMRGPVVG